MSAPTPSTVAGRAALALDTPGELSLEAPYGELRPIARLLRRVLEEYGLGRVAPEAPLAEIVPAGSHVLIKPNFVLHQNQAPPRPLGDDCLFTSPSLILALLGELSQTAAARVTIGDAPVQGCDFSAIVTDELRRAARATLRADQRLDFVDLRRTVLRSEASSLAVDDELRPMERYLRFDLGTDSRLEAVTSPAGDFRVTMYDPGALARTHAPGRHQYLVAKELFEADVIFNVPKLKTHRKAGLTGALKNLVGINGNKEFLPHHRVGGAERGGDCYPGVAPLKRVAELCLDQANRRIGQATGALWRKGAGVMSWAHQSLRRWPWLTAYFDGDPELEGGWHGNDTVWRMCLDLNTIALYGQLSGSLSARPQRRIWSLTDAIVCGEGEGPLAPEPLFVGALTFADNAVAADWLNAALLRLDPRRIPLLREAAQSTPRPLLAAAPAPSYRCEGGAVERSAVARSYGVDARPPEGWVGHSEDLEARAGAREGAKP